MATSASVKPNTTRYRAAAQAQQLPDASPVSLAVALTHQRLRALGDTVEDGRCHQCKVCHHAIGCHSHIACQPQEQQVEDRRGHGRGHLTHKAGDAQLAALEQQPRRRPLAHELNAIGRFAEMQAADGNADDGRNGRCQRRAGQAPAHGEDEDIVKHHIEQAAAQGGHHGQRGVAVVPGKGRNDVVAHEERREQQEDAGILQAQRHNGCIAAHQPEHRIRTERPYQHKRHCNQDRAHQAVGEIAVGPLIVLRLEDGIAGG